jgi:transcriptional regulator GlxA family with amidase domain
MHRIAYAVVPNFQVMLFAGMTVFELANRLAPTPFYDLRLLSATGGPVSTSLGIPMPTEAPGRKVFDTVIAVGALDIDPAPAELLFTAGRKVVAARGVGLHRCVRAGGGGHPGWAARDHALGLCA